MIYDYGLEKLRKEYRTKDGQFEVIQSDGEGYKVYWSLLKYNPTELICETPNLDFAIKITDALNRERK